MPNAERPQAPFAEEGQHRLLLDAITDYAIYMLDPAGIITSWNSGAQRFSGYTPAEIVGRHFSLFHTEEDQQAGLPQRSLDIAINAGKYEAENLRVRKDGSVYWAHVVIDPILDPTGKLVGFATITRDLTEKKAAEEALRQSEQQFRLLVQGDGYVLQALVAGAWQTLYEFDLQPQQRADYEMACWYLCHHPDSRFVRQLLAARVDGTVRYGLLDRAFSELSFSSDPLAATFPQLSKDSVTAGAQQKEVDLNGFVDLTALNNVRQAAGLPAVDAAGLDEQG